ncbi:MAG: DUF1587 domain-containing protein [Myxococcota bacterium]
MLILALIPVVCGCENLVSAPLSPGEQDGRENRGGGDSVSGPGGGFSSPGTPGVGDGPAVPTLPNGGSDVDSLRRLTNAELVQLVEEALGISVPVNALQTLPQELRVNGFANNAAASSVNRAYAEAVEEFS